MGKEISPEAIQRELKTALIGGDIRHYPTISSTMDLARQAARERAGEGTVIIADYQTAGRGRLDREWLSPPEDSLLLSVVLYPPLELLHRLTLVACLAVTQTIEKVAGLETAIKWPNDVLIAGRKVSGTLIESDVRGEAVNYAIVGIALNVNLDPQTIPEIAETATSLKRELGHQVSRTAVLLALLGELDAVYGALRRGEPIDEEWRRRLETLGKRVTVRCGMDVQEGDAEGVDEDGNLLLRLADGRLTTIAAGDVTLRAP